MEADDRRWGGGGRVTPAACRMAATRGLINADATTPRDGRGWRGMCGGDGEGDGDGDGDGDGEGEGEGDGGGAEDVGLPRLTGCGGSTLVA